MKLLKVAACAVLLAVLLGGCSSAFWVNTEQPQNLVLKPYKHLYVGWVGLREDDWQTYGYATKEEWVGQIKDFNVKGLQAYVKEWMPGMQVSGAPAPEQGLPTEGDLYLKFTYLGIEQHWDAFSATPDQMKLEVEFIDLATKETVYKNTMVATSLGRFGPRNWACNVFDGRVDNTMYNLAEWLKIRLGA
jgi:hypothetical protein